jgi:hypothetical protein
MGSVHFENVLVITWTKTLIGIRHPDRMHVLNYHCTLC